MPSQIKGVGGAAGIAQGHAARYVTAQPVAWASESSADALARFVAAQAVAAERLRSLAEQFRSENRADEAGIFEAQALLVEDEFLSDEVTRLIDDEGRPLENALDTTVAQMRATLAELDDAYLRERAADMDAIGREIHRALRGQSEPPEIPPGAIVVAGDLTPTETAELRDVVAGFVTAFGGPNGHTAILARSLGIPAVVGLGAAALQIADGTPLILDGDRSLLLVDPTEDERAEYQRRIAAATSAISWRQLLRDQPGRMADGHPVALWANIGGPDEARAALEHGAEGIGLFRTEFLFLDRAAPPGEDEQYAAYRATLEIMQERTVIVRTVDIGGDKPLPYIEMPREPNPFLGARGLRLCMRRPDLLATQLRALLRAALHGNLWIMLPMVTTPADLAWARKQLWSAATALAAEGIAHRQDVPLGVMIEIPAAAVTADLLARDAAFFSVGSNDLAQYTLAADRGQAELTARYPHDSPAVLRLIKQAAEAARRANIPIGVCGELAGDASAAIILAGLGVDELSMAPAAIPLVKERLLNTTLDDASKTARYALDK